ncbi:MAG TPA: dipeptidase PepE [Candidatus Saccharimonadales bacterium]|nr:dipeptidase PepE [Candidatus Saccharimonadales bacterium]
MQLLLVSSSFVSGGNYLEHAREAVKEFLDACPPGEVLYVPYAAHPSKWDEYAASAEQFFASLGQSCRSLHVFADPAGHLSVTQLKAVFCGGGNTFLLIKTLQEMSLVEPIRDVVQAGAGYMGASAGSVIACPTMQTTNDMPIVEPESFASVGLVDFHINAHFVSGSLMQGHMGETREQRIAEFHQFTDRKVIGLPEPSWIHVNDGSTTVGGGAGAIIFEKGQPERPWPVGTELS